MCYQLRRAKNLVDLEFSGAVRMKKILSLIFILGSLFQSGCGTEEDGPARTIQAGAYANSALGLQMTFPAHWTIETDEVFGDVKADIVALAPPVNSFSANVSVIYEGHSGPTAMAEVLPMLRAQMQAQFADLSGYQETILSIDGKEVGQIEYETSMNGHRFRFLVLLFVNRGKDISITFTDKADTFAGNGEFPVVKASIRIQP